ncbi:hypothetical protein STTU_5971 [Streptomyces sp. Tu6071]|nr:hypothetical protein STTU_5971 [Streptomyces sp. Tu6071]
MRWNGGGRPAARDPVIPQGLVIPWRRPGEAPDGSARR